jgi:hypothetical protein
MEHDFFAAVAGAYGEDWIDEMVAEVIEPYEVSE